METETWLMQKKKHACRSCYGHGGLSPVESRYGHNKNDRRVFCISSYRTLAS